MEEERRRKERGFIDAKDNKTSQAYYVFWVLHGHTSFFDKSHLCCS
jgi:hypothetical protein